MENELDKSRDYLRLKWTGGDPCDNSPNPEDTWGFSIDVVCSDVAIEDSRFFYIGGFKDSCRIKTQFESKLGCAIVSYRQISEFFYNNRIIFSIVLISLGFFLTFFGYRIILFTMFLCGVIATILACSVVAYQFFITENTPQYVFWIVLGGSAILG